MTTPVSPPEERPVSALLLPAPPAQVNTHQAPSTGYRLYLPSPPASTVPVQSSAVPTLAVPSGTGSHQGQLLLPSRGLSVEVTSIAPSQVLYVPPPALVAASPQYAVSPESASPGADEDGQANGPQKRKNKPRRNWDSDETKRLVRGVEKYGIGAWAKIRADEE